MARVIGGNSTIARKKDMGHMSMLVETNTSGNLYRITNTGMEYSDIQTEQYIKDNIHRIKEKVMDI